MRSIILLCLIFSYWLVVIWQLTRLRIINVTNSKFFCGSCQSPLDEDANSHYVLENLNEEFFKYQHSLTANSIALNGASSHPQFVCHFSKWRNNCCNSGVASARKIATPVAQMTCSPAACTMGATSRFISSVLDMSRVSGTSLMCPTSPSTVPRIGWL